jgi:hypothetical protein
VRLQSFNICKSRGSGLTGSLSGCGRAGELAAQLLDLAALFRQSSEPKIAVMAHQALDHGIDVSCNPINKEKKTGTTTAIGKCP